MPDELKFGAESASENDAASLAQRYCAISPIYATASRLLFGLVVTSGLEERLRPAAG